MIPEHEMVVLTCDLPEHGLKEGDFGTIVYVHKEAGYMVEFMTVDGDTVAVVTLETHQVRPVGPHEMRHARAMEKRA